MAQRSEKVITLALQGGGAHGAFTWGVLDRLLQQPDLRIEGISGTSAGAINAAAVADGYQRAGHEGARECLEGLWRAFSRHVSTNPYRSGWWLPFGPRYSPWAAWADWLSQLFSPYELNPLNVNPLRDILVEALDFDTLRQCRDIRLFISATNVRTNRLHIFTAKHVTPEVLLASACLPQLYQAVEIAGEYFWDGGFMGNPVLEPLVSRCCATDIVIVQVNPKRRESVPTTAMQISDRVNEITFNASLLREIRSIARITKMLEDLAVTGHDYEKAYFHMIAGEDLLAGLGLRSKFDTDWRFLTALRDRGRERAASWIDENWDSVGQRSTLDLENWIPPYD